MRVYTNSDELLRVVDIAKNVANTYRNSVLNKALLTSKLNSLRLEIVTSFTGKTVGYFVDCMPLKKKGAKYNIKAYVNSRNDEMIIAFTLAHEFAHLFFANNLDNLKIVGGMNKGCFMLSSFKRMNHEGKVFGEALEEYAADYLAKFIVHKMYKGQYSPEYEMFLESKAFRFEVIERYSAFFGNSLESATYIDEYIKVRVGNRCTVSINNSMWYSVPTMSTQEVICDFNKCLKDECAYQYFCDLIESYEKTHDERKKTQIKKFLKRAGKLIA